ncbi:MAG: ribonuclease HII [Bernardetiaceae bacterium]|nr:ribonuclease HII [Bernardetiaceae bacterium]
MLISNYSGKYPEAGTDEAGRGALAGPVTAAAVILPPDYQNAKLNDSKILSLKWRNILKQEIEAVALAYAVVHVSPQEIDKINILQASFLAMNRAVAQLELRPAYLLVDGNRFYNQTDVPHTCLIKGDARFLSIAAASVLAKTARDEYMQNLALSYPDYAWERNVGYPTKAHREAIRSKGVSPHHRQSFRLL